MKNKILGYSIGLIVGISLTAFGLLYHPATLPGKLENIGILGAFILGGSLMFITYLGLLVIAFFVIMGIVEMVKASKKNKI